VCPLVAGLGPTTDLRNVKEYAYARKATME
jgi:hypothetical protein